MASDSLPLPVSSGRRRHFEHHAKPNVVRKDPDITFPHLFLLGDRLTRNWAKSKKGAHSDGCLSERCPRR